VQAGGCGEHSFTKVRFTSAESPAGRTAHVDGKYLHVHLRPATRITLELGMDLLANDPSYAPPW
jgi:hypothetical protein